MDFRNPAFMGVVETRRNAFKALVRDAKVGIEIAPSRHFFERVVERDLDHVDVLRFLIPVIKEFRTTTYNQRTFCIKWKQHRMFADITIGPVTGRRFILLKTVFDKHVDETDFDVVVTI